MFPLLYLFLVGPGRAITEIMYLFPARGDVWASARRRESVIVHVAFSLAFWVILMFAVAMGIRWSIAHLGPEMFPRAGESSLLDEMSKGASPAVVAPNSSPEQANLPAAVGATQSESERQDAKLPETLFRSLEVWKGRNFLAFTQSLGSRASPLLETCAQRASSQAEAEDCLNDEDSRGRALRSEFISASPDPDETSRELAAADRVNAEECAGYDGITKNICRVEALEQANYAVGARYPG